MKELPSEYCMYEQSDQQQLKELQQQVSRKQSQIPIQSLVDQGSKSAKKNMQFGAGIWLCEEYLNRSSSSHHLTYPTLYCEIVQLYYDNQSLIRWHCE